jgi:hypothetical protein
VDESKEETMAPKRSAKEITITQPVKGKPLDLKMEDLRAVLGDHLEVACLNPNVIPGTRGSIMIPANEPCPTEPHNHDKSPKDKLFQKVFVIKSVIAKR